MNYKNLEAWASIECSKNKTVLTEKKTKKRLATFNRIAAEAKQKEPMNQKEVKYLPMNPIAEKYANV